MQQPIDKVHIAILYLPWQYQNLKNITRLCSDNPNLKLTVGFSNDFADLENTDENEYKDFLNFVSESKIEIALRLPHDPVLPLIA
ncbi:MAG: hypothetical protein GF384_06790, partial [Elusimicrobia bacterium]|nr:hypothetical protein [Elusimicrobiota bacterium]MBD3412407.1 hypothetical protein [Elusimicrobiota bacterium]